MVVWLVSHGVLRGVSCRAGSRVRWTVVCGTVVCGGHSCAVDSRVRWTLVQGGKSRAVDSRVRWAVVQWETHTQTHATCHRGPGPNQNTRMRRGTADTNLQLPRVDGAEAGWPGLEMSETTVGVSPKDHVQQGSPISSPASVTGCMCNVPCTHCE